MKSTRCSVLPALALGAALTWGAGYADPPAKPADPQPDAEFLEFLGSVDSASETDDGSWMEYLAQADIEKASKKASPPGQKVDEDANQGQEVEIIFGCAYSFDTLRMQLCPRLVSRQPFSYVTGY